MDMPVPRESDDRARSSGVKEGSPGFKTVVGELKGEIANLGEIFARHFDPPVAPPPGLEERGTVGKVREQRDAEHRSAKGAAVHHDPDRGVCWFPDSGTSTSPKTPIPTHH